MLLQFSRNERDLYQSKVEKIAIINTKNFFFQVDYSLSNKTCSIKALNYFGTCNYTIDEGIEDKGLAIKIIRYLTLSSKEEGDIVIYSDFKRQLAKEYFI